MSTLPKILTPEQINSYRTDGYLVVHDLLTDDEVEAYLSHENEANVASQYGLRGHTEDPQYRYLATHPKIAGIASQLLESPLRVVQTMYLGKPAGGKGIALHQDCHYLPNEPNTLMACWVAMTDTDGENGGLCVVPGSHHGGLRSAHEKQGDQEHDAFEMNYPMRDRDGREWTQRMYRFEIDDLDPATIVRLTVPRGAGVFFTGLTIHGSFANHSPDRPRLAFATHYVREDTWLFRRDVQDTMPVEIALSQPTEQYQ